MLRQLDNDGLFTLYDSDLVLRLHNEKNLKDTRKILTEFKQFLNEQKPSSDLAKSYLSQYSDRKPRTLYRYAQMLRVFMKWYGEPMNDVKVKRPKNDAKKGAAALPSAAPGERGQPTTLFFAPSLSTI